MKRSHPFCCSLRKGSERQPDLLTLARTPGIEQALPFGCQVNEVKLPQALSPHKRRYRQVRNQERCKAEQTITGDQQILTPYLLEQEEQTDGLGIEGMTQSHQGPFPGIDSFAGKRSPRVESMAGWAQRQQIRERAGTPFF